jgi:hypothetical protein
MALVDVAIARTPWSGVHRYGGETQVANQQRLFGRAFGSSSLLRSLRA